MTTSAAKTRKNNAPGHRNVFRHDEPYLLALGQRAGCLPLDQPRSAWRCPTSAVYLAARMLKVRNSLRPSLQGFGRQSRSDPLRGQNRGPLATSSSRRARWASQAGSQASSSSAPSPIAAPSRFRSHTPAKPPKASSPWSSGCGRTCPPSTANGILHRSRANTGQMVFDRLDSEFRVVSAGEENAGRGLTIQNLHLSEVARWPGDAQSHPRRSPRRARPRMASSSSNPRPPGPAEPSTKNGRRAEDSGLVRSLLSLVA